jgi:hypothetical protein
MELHELRDKSQFPAFYEGRKLTNAKDKMEFLIKAMGIRMLRSDSNMTDEEKLSTLQQYVLQSWDRRPPTPLSGACV